MKLRGTLIWLDYGPGSWALQTEEGTTFTLEGEVPGGASGQRVEVEGEPVDDAMGFAMSGPTLRVERVRSA